MLDTLPELVLEIELEFLMLLQQDLE